MLSRPRSLFHRPAHPWPATVLCNGDAGLWRLQREALPNATIVLDWWHAAVRFEYALQAAHGLGAADAKLAAELGLPAPVGNGKSVFTAFAKVGKFFWQQMTRIR